MKEIEDKKGSLALKEWAVVCQALAEGKQIFLLRKGGIRDQTFQLQGEIFLLYPTLEHQTHEDVKEAYQDLFRRYGSFDEEEFIPISHYAEIVKDVQMNSLESLKALSDHHIWTDAYLEKRFHYKSEKPLHLLVVRVYRLHKSHLHDYEERYAGCKSWVDLSETIPTDKAEPVLSDADFQRRLAELKLS